MFHTQIILLLFSWLLAQHARFVCPSSSFLLTFCQQMASDIRHHTDMQHKRAFDINILLHQITGSTRRWSSIYLVLVSRFNLSKWYNKYNRWSRIIHAQNFNECNTSSKPNNRNESIKRPFFLTITSSLNVMNCLFVDIHFDFPTHGDIGWQP